MNQVFRINGEVTLEKIFGKRNAAQVQSIAIAGNEATITYKTNHSMTMGDIMVYGSDGSEFELLQITNAKTVKTKVIKTGNPTETYCQAHQLEVIRDRLIRIGDMAFGLEKRSGYNYAVMHFFRDHNFIKSADNKDAIYLRDNIFVAVGPNLLAFQTNSFPGIIFHSDIGTLFMSSDSGVYNMSGERLTLMMSGFTNVPERMIVSKSSTYEAIVTPLYVGSPQIPENVAIANNLIHIPNNIYARRK